MTTDCILDYTTLFHKTLQISVIAWNILFGDYNDNISSSNITGFEGLYFRMFSNVLVWKVFHEVAFATL